MLPRAAAMKANVKARWTTRKSLPPNGFEGVKLVAEAEAAIAAALEASAARARAAGAACSKGGEAAAEAARRIGKTPAPGCPRS